MKTKKKMEDPFRKQTREDYARIQLENKDLEKTVMRREQDIGSYYYHGIDPRSKQEYADGGLVMEDRKAMSNLPPEGFQTQAPSVRFYSTPNIDRLDKK